MIINLETLHALEALSVEVKASGSLRRKALVDTVRRRALLRLNILALPYAVDLNPEEIVYTVLPGRADEFGCNTYRCRWSPQPGRAELAGGPKDGQELALVSQRTVIEFLVLAPDWRDYCEANPGAVVPKLHYEYRLDGYNIASRSFVFRCGDPVRLEG